MGPHAVNRASAAYRWNILALLAGSQAIAYIDRVNFAVVGPQLIQVYHYTPGQVGLLLSIFNWAFTFSLLAAGPLTDLIRPRRSYPLGVSTWSLATALCSLTKAFTPLAAFVALLGIGESLMIPSGARVIRETFDKKHRASAVGTFFAGNKIGLTLGIPFASVVLVNWGWEWVFYTTGALGLLWVLWWSAGLSPRQPRMKRRPRTPRQRSDGRLCFNTGPPGASCWGRPATCISTPSSRPGCRDISSCSAGMSALTTGFVGMLPFLFGTACTVLGGWAGDRLIQAGWRATLVRKGFAIGGLFCATLFTIVGAFTSDTTLAVTFLTLAVVSFSFATASVNSMAIDVAPPHIVSSLVSLQNFGGNVGGSFAPLVTGLLISASGDFTIPLTVAAGVALVFGCGSYGFIVGNLDSELGKR